MSQNKTENQKHEFRILHNAVLKLATGFNKRADNSVDKNEKLYF